MFLSYCRKHGLHEPSVIDLTRTGACPPPAQPWGPKGAAQTPLPSTPTLSLHRSLPPRPTVGRLPGPGGWPLTLRGCRRGCPWGWRWQWESQDVETEQTQRGDAHWQTQQAGPAGATGPVDRLGVGLWAEGCGGQTGAKTLHAAPVRAPPLPSIPHGHPQALIGSWPPGP